MDIKKRNEFRLDYIVEESSDKTLDMYDLLGRFVGYGIRHSDIHHTDAILASMLSGNPTYIRVASIRNYNDDDYSLDLASLPKYRYAGNGLYLPYYDRDVDRRQSHRPGDKRYQVDDRRIHYLTWYSANERSNDGRRKTDRLDLKRSRRRTLRRSTDLMMYNFRLSEIKGQDGDIDE